MNNTLTRKFDKYKMEIFNEIVKLIWEDKIDDIEKIPQKIIEKESLTTEDKISMVNLMRVVMGLNPISSLEENQDLKSMAKEAMHLDEIHLPVISVIEDICKRCENHNITEEGKLECHVKDKHSECVEKDTCSACGECMHKCNLGAISDKIQFVPMIKMLKDESIPIYAIVAPAFVGQFGKEVSPGKLRTALKSMGFEDMIEVALAADILSAKEAYEYVNHIKEHDGEYFITSCCCPVWVSLIQNNFPNLIDSVSPSVSPMVACGRAIKVVSPNAKVVFIGPCTAKKKEATIDDIKDAVDFVLTFKELEEIFNSLNIDPSTCECEDRSEASYAGRVYAVSGGVSEAIRRSVERIEQVPFKGIAFNGIKECREGVQNLLDNKIDATFIEGMGCVGGCVGGPRRNLSVDEGERNVKDYCEETKMDTPFDNINVSQFLTSLGIKHIDNLGCRNDVSVANIFSRNFKGKK